MADEYGIIHKNDPQSDSGIYKTDLIMHVSEHNREMLSWLLYVEVRGMGFKTTSAGLSTLDTVFRRTNDKYLSNGTLKGTVSRCNKDYSVCQFPAWVSTLSCDGILHSVCPLMNPTGLNKMRAIVDMYLAGWRGKCSGYYFYNSISGGYSNCTLKSSTTSDYLEFHNGG